MVYSWGWLFLGTMIVAYGVANLLQAVAAADVHLHREFHPRLLVTLSRHRAYIAGVSCQLTGFVLAILARRDLPLFLVQSAVAAGLGVTAVLGVLTLHWRLPKAEIGLLSLLCLGIAGLIVSAKPATAKPIGHTGVLLLWLSLLAVAAGGFAVVHLHGVVGSVAIGSLAGLAFGAAAVAARAVAGAHSATEFMADPLLYLLIAHSLLGQLLLAMAMQRGSITASVASMDAAAAVPAAAIGVFLMGDGIVPGLEWLAILGFLITLCSVLGLVYYAEPQCHPHHPVEPTHGPRLPSEHAPSGPSGETIGSGWMRAWLGGTGGAD